MADQRLKDLQGESRRRFLKFAGAAGAMLALDRAEVLNVIADSGGSALADEAACTSETNRSLHLVAGNGGFAWFQLLFPHNEVAASGNENFAYHAFGPNTGMFDDTDNPLTYGPETPWRDMGKNFRMSAFMAGNNETHTGTPNSATQVGNGNGMLASIGAIQSQLSSLLPVIGVQGFAFGAAPGAPQVTQVGDPMGMVDLFNSSASKALLSIPQQSQMYEAYYKAFLGLNAAAKRATWARQMRITKASANFLGKNLASLLQPTIADYDRYGVGVGAPSNVRELGEGLMIAVKAFKLGLTNMVILPAMRDDPHGAFANMGSLGTTVQMLGQMLNATYADLAALPDPACAGKSLADTTVMTIHGDTPKDPLDRSGWPDGTPNNTNWLYVLGGGFTKTGWFGGVKANGNTDGFDPATGQTLNGAGSAQTTAAASAAALFAVAQGDMVRVQQFYSGGSIAGIVNEVLL